jgi:hypothetical protein
MISIHQCQRKAEEIGYNSSRFLALFPAGPEVCRWLDAYVGLLIVDEDGMRDGFVTVSQLDDMFPNLVCSEPYLADEVVND